MAIRYTDIEFADAVKQSVTYSGVCRVLGLVPRGGNLNTVRRKIALLGLDISHFKGQGWNRGFTIVEHEYLQKKTLSELLVENSTTKSDYIKKRMLLCGIKQHKCECCGITEWMGKDAPLELHHKNGVHTDNRIENLQVLCPNCHAQTENYTNKNKHRKDTSVIHVFKKTDETIGQEVKCVCCGSMFTKRFPGQKYCSTKCARYDKRKNKDVNRDVLIQAFCDYKSFSAVGRMFNVSDKAVVKWCKSYNLPTNRKDMNAFIRNYIG